MTASTERKKTMNKLETISNIGSSIKENWKLVTFKALMVKETEKAILVDFSFDLYIKDECWVPKSLINAIYESDSEFDLGCVFEVPMWWAIQNATSEA